ncbi:MAG: DUF6056 family protein [Euryarchaeota archaeon]|jgi:hypothetical protein|uniref:DUF6056 family protein n=1 Tax=Methanobacterium sp. MZD130B TaxID=3394378 RepID=UPI0039FCA4EC|nr:DUF6056 family protein [Euryarchaeota archaeon]
MITTKLHVKKSSLLMYLPLIIFFIIIFLWHSRLIPAGDDLYFSKVYYEQNIFVFLAWHYETWTSRLIIEFFITIFAGLPQIIWNIIDSAIFTLIAVIIPKITFNDNKINEKKSLIYYSLSCVLVLLYIYTINGALWSAGYIASTITYTWPLFFMLLHFYLVKKYLFNENNLNNLHIIKNLAIYGIMIFSLIFAINNEILLFIVAGAYVFIILYCWYQKIKIPKSIFLMLFIIFLGFLNFYLCPGNQARYMKDILRRFPEYYTLTIINKIDLGISALIYKFITPYGPVKFGPIYLTFFGALTIYIYSITKKKIPLLISMIPLILILSLLILIFLVGYSPIIAFMNKAVTEYGLLHSDLSHIMIISGIYSIVTFSVVYSLIKIYKYGGKRLSSLILCLLILGFASQMIKGFSPTCWFTGERWEVYYYFFITCVIYILTVELLENRDDEGKITDW